LSGKLVWFDMTPSSTHDRQCFPDIQSLVNRLVLVDLGYWDFCLLWMIDNVGGFFRSRIKSNAVVYITEFVQGNFSKKHLGKTLFSLPLKRFRGNIFEVNIEKECSLGVLACRAIAFWNPIDKSYHWYITNLKTTALLIYPLYRFRWQIELVFKACKPSLNANRLTSNHNNIIESLFLASIIAHLASHTILEVVIPSLSKVERLAISVQRTAKVAVSIASDLVNFFLNGTDNYAKILLSKNLVVC
jgi:IS4 transposase